MKYYVGASGKSEYLRSPSGVPIIVDTIRASSTIIAALWNGADRVIPVEDDREALQLGKDTGAVLIGERHGEKIEGFDLNNSPSAMMNMDIKGKAVVITTSNGTRIMVENGIIASTLNAGAVADHIKSSERAYLLASGSPEKSDEDLYTAKIIEIFLKKLNSGYTIDEAVYSSYHEHEYISLLNAIYRSKSADRIRSIGYGEDIRMIITSINEYPIIPTYRDGVIKAIPVKHAAYHAGHP